MEKPLLALCVSLLLVNNFGIGKRILQTVESVEPLRNEPRVEVGNLGAVELFAVDNPGSGLYEQGEHGVDLVRLMSHDRIFDRMLMQSADEDNVCRSSQPRTFWVGNPAWRGVE